MKDSDLATTVKLARQALALVARGTSEREGIARSIRSDPTLAGVRRAALDLVLETVKEQDLLDVIISDPRLSNRLDMGAVSLFRLVAHMALHSKSRIQIQRLERNLRDVTPPKHVTSVQILIGRVLSHDNFPNVSRLTDYERIGLQAHYPSWWVKYCFRIFGRSEAIHLLTSCPRPRYVRVNPLRNGGRLTLPTKMKASTSSLTVAHSRPTIYTMENHPSIISKFFPDGLFQMQDLGSFLAVKAANPNPGEKVLDLCAAPGGKTGALAQMMKNRGRIVSVDYSKARMRSWQLEVARLGVKIAEGLVCDGSSLALLDTFDLVFIDPPCSGTGILDRNPSMKWRLTSEMLERYSRIQRGLLDSASCYVREHGRILYCTCSVTLEENERVISSFLRSHPDFETNPALEESGSPGMEGLTDCRRLWPHRDRTAGYFIALMKKVA